MEKQTSAAVERRNSAELYSYPSVVWKECLVGMEIGYLAEEISKRTVEGTSWFLLTAYSKM